MSCPGSWSERDAATIEGWRKNLGGYGVGPPCEDLAFCQVSIGRFGELQR